MSQVYPTHSIEGKNSHESDTRIRRIFLGHDPRCERLMSTKKSMACVPVLLGGILALVVSLAQGKEKTYWHFTIKATVVPDRAEEWAWVTFVEMSKEDALPETAEKVRQLGGALTGTKLGQVRAAAWRSGFSYARDRRCDDRPSKIEISWTSSSSDQVLAHCQLKPAQAAGELFGFKLGFCATRARVLMEDGQTRGLADLSNLIVGPIDLGGGQREEMRGKFTTHAINYEDDLTHYKFCGKSWAEQFDSLLLHYTSEGLRGSFVDKLSDTDGTGSFNRHGLDIVVLVTVIRNNSREHPHWKQKDLNR
jgi:hypothetical protein